MNDTVKPKLVILNDFFYPAYKAGGPIQSLVNLIVLLENDYEIYVVTAARDLNEITPMQVKLNQWSELLLPSSKEKINIWYSDNNKIKKILNGIIVDINPSAVYLNGMYSFSYVILPILYLKNIKIVICPRGMIQQGALSGKYLKKVTFLTLLKSTGLLKNVWWHATSKIEQHDIKRIFGKKSNIILAGNVPKALFKNIIPCEKRKNELRLVYISLITSKKNLLLSIEAIIKSDKNITLDIFGPIKDVDYWKKCEALILKSNGKIKYIGDLVPEKVQETFCKYDAGLFLTKAENFGHALYESLSCARPIITSNFTPWRNLESQFAGWNVDISDLNVVLRKLNIIADMDNAQFENYCKGAYNLAMHYYENGVIKNEYQKLF